MFRALWLSEFVLHFAAASVLVSSSLLQIRDYNKTVCAQTCHLPLHLRLSPSTEDLKLHCTAPSTAILLRGCKAALLMLGSISHCLQQAAGSLAQQGSFRHQFQKLFLEVMAVSGRMLLHCLHEIKCQSVCKNIRWKNFDHTNNLSPLCLGICLITPDGFNTQDWGSSCLLWPSSSSHCHSGGLDNGLSVLSTTFSRSSCAIELNWPKTTFPPKGMILPSFARLRVPGAPLLLLALLTLQLRREWELGSDGAESSSCKERKRSFSTGSAGRPVSPCNEVEAGSSGHCPFR